MEQNYLKKLNTIYDSFKGNKKDKVKLAQHFDLTGFLAHNLTIADKASMLTSIELRVPLLDENVAAYGLSLPSKQLLGLTKTKKPLKSLLSSILPKNLVARPKTGFNPPLDDLILKIGKQKLKEEMDRIGQIINIDCVNKLINEHFSGYSNNTYKLWQLLYFSSWIKENG